MSRVGKRDADWSTFPLAVERQDLLQKVLSKLMGQQGEFSLHDLALNNHFLYMTPKKKQLKEK